MIIAQLDVLFSPSYMDNFCIIWVGQQPQNSNRKRQLDGTSGINFDGTSISRINHRLFSYKPNMIIINYTNMVFVSDHELSQTKSPYSRPNIQMDGTATTTACCVPDNAEFGL